MRKIYVVRFRSLRAERHGTESAGKIDVFANAVGAAFVNKRSRTSLKVRDEISENDPATNRKTGLASECYEQDIYIGW